MKKTLMTAMKDSIFNVLETMFFLSVDIDEKLTVPQSSLLSSGKILGCRLPFTGASRVVFYFFIPEFLLADITENFVGEDKSSLTEEHLKGTLNEILNMVAGSTFAQYDELIEVKLGIPEPIHVDEAMRQALSSYSEYYYLVETTEGFLLFKFELDD